MKKLNKNEKVAVFVSLAVISFFFLLATALGSLFRADGPLNVAANQEATSIGSEITDLISEDILIGSGKEAELGKLVRVHYTGTLSNGEQFDSSIGRDPIQFVLGTGRVIQGWDEGLVGMKEGGRRILVIPPSLGYGNNSVGPIPANSTLIFDVELVAVEEI